MSDAEFPPIERIELRRMAGKLVDIIEHQRLVNGVRSNEGTLTPRMHDMLIEAEAVRNRIIEMAESLPEGRLEAFAREHPMFDDPLDGPYCGYGYDPEFRKRTKFCEVRDAALHWDAWELKGTIRKRPEYAVRKAKEA